MALSTRASASPRPPSSALPSLPPSRQSTRIITPVKTHANYIRPNSDTQRSLVNVSNAASDQEISSEGHQTPFRSSKRASKSTTVPTSSAPDILEGETSTSKGNTSSKTRKRKHITLDNSDPNVGIMDFTQDSDVENSKATKIPKKTRGAVLKDVNDIGLYFEPPFQGKGETSGPNMNYKCKWCSNIYKHGKDSRSNLLKHCDGDLK
ncbi:hypothetical protein PCASD_06265 [Puccinia coronata f. sp. avenae]|uniref:Uncharacterized protein n=1 Tax=Puccinia coronata f. sp. avenae TaxID=200324 RepID=A0A2N5V6E9_9BASI|nr:hypothetical protein PCASD_24757 [Puccinia coronata f. sp. avenae]PLW45548.1 hypothetical protein PCASD_06265 [Puccinia coronata f. sp. avenae]